MFIKKDRSPLRILVTESEWGAYGDPANPRHAMLYGLVEAQGGINHSVMPGWYEFNAKRKGLKIELTLVPSEN